MSIFRSARGAVALGALLSVAGGGAAHAADAVADRFAALDADHDGGVSWEEFHAVNENISRQGFDSIDSSGDERISLEEWRVFYAGHGMGVPAPSSRSTLPARSATPPLVMPPPNPGTPEASTVPASPETERPVSPARPDVDPSTMDRKTGPGIPIVMPPRAASEATIPEKPAGPLPPLVRPPAGPTVDRENVAPEAGKGAVSAEESRP